jgi:3-oxoacyl-[acyl-carrier-protein] synthase II
MRLRFDGRPCDPAVRVVVTGLGVVSHVGMSLEQFWTGLFGPPAEGMRRVEDFDPSVWFGPKEVRRVDRFAQMAVAAAEMAHGDAGSPEVEPERAGVIFGTGVGGIETLEDQIRVCQEKGPRRTTPFLVPMIMSNAAPATISIRRGWMGPNETVVTACAAGTPALAGAARLVASGRVDVAIGGGSEAAITPVCIAGFRNMTALSTTGHSMPFDVHRDGFVLAEGAAAVVLESLDHARARGARIYAEIVGTASNADAHHITAPSPGGSGATTCMRLALEDAGVTPEQIAHINAHGTSTPLNDIAEAQAIEAVFGEPGPPVTSCKGALGHSLGAAGALEAVASCLTLLHREIPPTAGLEEQDPAIHLDVVVEKGRPLGDGLVLSNSFGFGGHNGCIVFAPPPV